MNNDDLEKYSDDSFWEKIKNFARDAGEAVIEPALRMYYAAQDPATPVWAKTTIYGALGYFISPIDAIPDFTPVVGYSDDLGVLVVALATVSNYVTDEHIQKAKETFEEWFGISV